MKTTRSFLFALLFNVALLVPLLLPRPQTALADDLQVVATIKPIHSLVAGVMGSEPTLIVEGKASPHGYSLRPSDVRALNGADVIFRVSPLLETSIDKPIESLGLQTRVVTLEDVAGVVRYDLREGANFADHDHDDEHHDEHDDEHHGDEEAHHDDHDGDHHAREDNLERDTHLWLDPENVRVWLPVIANALAEANPQNAALYHSNAARMDAELKDLIQEVQETLASVSADRKQFIVFHDAYRYFEERFGVEVVGAVSLHPDKQISAKRLGEIYHLMEETEVSCIFSEPQFSSRIVAQISAKKGVKVATLDPLGANLEDGAGLYPALIRALATTMRDCLKTST